MSQVEPASDADGIRSFADPTNPTFRVPERWLADYEKLQSAERLARLEADRDLIEDLSSAGFAGAHYIYFVTELSKYGLAVIGGWTRRGMILDKVAKKGFGGLQPPPRNSFDDKDVVEELANETVAKALNAFRDQVLVPGKWDAKRGATLKTYFIGQCLMQFPNVYRRWYGETFREEAVLTHDGNVSKLDRRLGDDVADVARIRDEASRALANITNPSVRRVFKLYADGYTQSEIASQINTTVKGVERMIANERERQKRRRTR